MEVLDIAAQADKSFDIHGGFKAAWRSHVWEGMAIAELEILNCYRKKKMIQSPSNYAMPSDEETCIDLLKRADTSNKRVNLTP